MIWFGAIKRRAHTSPSKKKMEMLPWGGLPVHVWTKVSEVVAQTRSTFRRGVTSDVLRMLTVNKQIVAVARAVMGRIGITIRCTVAQIPRAIRVFEYARELCVVGAALLGPPVEAARAALESSGTRFRVFTSDDTDSESRMAWLPRRSEAAGYTVVCVCSETKRFGDVVEGLALAVGMSELVIEYLGVPDVLPNLSRIPNGANGRLCVTIQHADFDYFDTDVRGFTSTAVTELAFKRCDMAHLPPMTGFPALKRLEITECVFGGLGDLGEPPVPPIEYLGVEGCEGLCDVSPIARLPKLTTLVMRGCRAHRQWRVEYPEFDGPASAALKGRLVSGALNAAGTGCLCKKIGRMLDITRAEREAARLARCDEACCGCDCGECSDCE